MSPTEIADLDIVGNYLIPWGTRLVLAALVFVVGRWIVRWLVKALERLMTRSKLDAMLVSFVGNIVYSALLVVVVLAALEQLGVNTTSALAVLGAAGLAVGLALQNSLSNFAAGVMLIVFRPFNRGNFVEVAGISGVVEEIRIFNTVMKTGDNREITIPNGQIYDGIIVNYSARDSRRIDLVIGIGYDDDIRQARTLIQDVLAAEQRILPEPAPVVMVLELADSSVNLAVRPWVASGDYWAVRSDLLEGIKREFDAKGVSIPYPQRDVHLIESKPAA